MSSPSVGQLQVLGKLFSKVLGEVRPKSLAVFGCATGNGFEYIDPNVTERIVGVDINADYLKMLKERFSGQLLNLDLLEQDFATPKFSIQSVELAFAALIFEYVPVEQAIQSIRDNLVPKGMLVAVLQLPDKSSSPVTKTEFRSLGKLQPIMKLVEPERFTQLCSKNGFDLEKERIIPLKQGKAFFVGYYRIVGDN